MEKFKKNHPFFAILLIKVRGSVRFLVGSVGSRFGSQEQTGGSVGSRFGLDLICSCSCLRLDLTMNESRSYFYITRSYYE